MAIGSKEAEADIRKRKNNGAAKGQGNVAKKRRLGVHKASRQDSRKDGTTSILDIPKDIIEAHISPYLSLQDLRRLALASKEIKDLFKQSLRNARLLEYVAFGEQSEAEEILARRPELALKKETVRDHAGRIFENITVFQYAAWALDWQMWKMIRKYLTIKQAQEQARGFSQGSWVAKHGEHVDWKELIEAYETLIYVLGHNFHDSNGGDWNDVGKIDEHWVKQIGGAQLQLPMHVLQEYTQPDRYFGSYTRFVGSRHHLVRTTISSAALLELGKKAGLVRGGVIEPAWLIKVDERKKGHLSNALIFNNDKLLDHIKDDMAALSSLLSVRTQQRAVLVAELIEDPALQVEDEEVEEFLDYVVAGDQPKAEAMLKENPDLALAAGTVTDHAERTFENITGFQYAMWALDWQMWEMIRTYLHDRGAQKQAGDLAKGSWVKEYREYFNWNELIDAYKTLIDNWETWGLEKIAEHWVKQIGSAQRRLPAHVLQEYNQPYRPFNLNTFFDSDRNLVRTTISPEALLERGLGQAVAIVRGDTYELGAELMRLDREKGARLLDFLITNKIIDRIKDDAAALASLLRIRTQQRAELVVELEREFRSNGAKFRNRIMQLLYKKLLVFANVERALACA